MLLMKILNEDPVHPCKINPTIPPQLGDAVYKAIRKSPRDRFEDAAAFRRILQCYSPDTPAQTGLNVTQYRDSSDPLLLDKKSRSRTPFQLELSDSSPNHYRGKQIAVLIAIVATLLIAGIAVFAALKARYHPNPAAIVSVVSTPPANLESDTSSVSKNVPPPLLKTISVEISVTPDTAIVQIDGNNIGRGSVEYNAPADGKLHVLRITAYGFEPHQSKIRFDDSKRLPIKLIPVNPSDYKATKTPKTTRKDGASKNGQARAASDPKNTPPSASSTPTEDDTQSSTLRAARETDNASDTAAQKRPSRIIDEVNPW